MDHVESELRKLSMMKAYSFLDKNPEENLPKLLDWLDQHMAADVLAPQRQLFRDIISKKDSNWYRLIVSLWTDLDDDMRKTLFENVLINANARAAAQVKANKEKYHCNIPWVISIDLGKEDGGLGFEIWDRVIDQAKSLGTFIFVFGGDRPLRSKEALIALCNKNRDCEFMVITEGEDIDEDFVRQILRVKNLIIALHTSETVMSGENDRAARLLQKNRVPYAALASYDAASQGMFANETYFDDLIAHGVKLVFFATTISEEEDDVFRRVGEYRKTKPIVSIHLCKDRGIIGGCMAGGRYYCNINAAGQVEPCFFIQESDSDILSGTLLDAYRAPLFQSYCGSCVECRAVKKQADEQAGR